MVETDEKVLESLYEWLDSIPFSRPKKNLARDFSDGVLAAEMINYFFPNLIQMHNYPPTNSVANKKMNWQTLSRKVLAKLDIPLSEHTINDLATAKRDATEYFLMNLREKIAEAVKKREDRQNQRQQVDYYNYSPEKREHAPKCPAEMFVEPKYQTGKEFREPQIWPAGGECIGSEHPFPVRQDKYGGNVAETAHHQKAWVPRGPGFDTVPVSVYEQKEQEVLMREETIQILQARIRRLEHMIYLKDLRIDELNKAIGEMHVGEKDAAPYTTSYPEGTYPQAGLAEIKRKHR